MPVVEVGDSPDRAEQKGKEILAWKTDDAKTLASIDSYLSDSVSDYIRQCRTSKAAWDELQVRFEIAGASTADALEKSLSALTLMCDEEIDEHLSNFDTIVGKLSALGERPSEVSLARKLIASLDDVVYRHLHLEFELRQPTESTYRELVALLSRLSSSHKAKSGLMAPAALLAKKRRGRTRIGAQGAQGEGDGRIECSNCHRKGHLFENCWAKGGGKEGQGPYQGKGKAKEVKASTSRRKGAAHLATSKNDDSSYSDSSVLWANANVLEARASQPPNATSQQWIADSGSTHHLSPLKPESSSYVPFPKPKLIGLAGKGQSITSPGSSTIPIATPTGSIDLSDVHLATNATSNLLSLPQLADTGYTVVLEKGGGKIYSKKTASDGIELKRQGAYWVLEDIEGAKSEAEAFAGKAKRTLLEWHEALGHIGKGRLIKLAKGLAVGFSLEDIADPDATIQCDACSRSKSTRLPFPKSSLNRSAKLLHLVHSDLAGPFQTSLAGAHYYITFIDDHSRYTWVSYLKRKGDAFDAFKQWRAYVEKEYDAKVARLRTDRGGEYTSADFDRYLASNGIKHETTAARTPEQNGVAEEKNRVLKETGSALLKSSGLGQEYWAMAIDSAARSTNNAPSASVSTTPYTVLTGRKPNLSNEHPFGCVVYRHVPKEDRTKSLATSKGQKGIYLGHARNTKAFKIATFEGGRRKFCDSRDVVFWDNRRFHDDDDDVKSAKKSSRTRAPPTSPASIALPPSGATTPEIPSTPARTPTPVESDHDDEQPEAPEAIPFSTRPRRDIRLPARYRDSAYGSQAYGAYALMSQALRTVAVADDSPQSYAEAMASEHRDEWEHAMDAEIQSLEETGTWEVVDRPIGRKVVGGRWVFTTKRDVDYSIIKRKGRYVAKGYSQIPGTDFEETYAPTSRLEGLRVLFSIAAAHDLDLVQLDVKTAFLYPPLKDVEIYVELPEGYREKHRQSDGTYRVGRLKKALYGLRQAARCWWQNFGDTLSSLGFVRLNADWGLYILRGSDEHDLVIILVHVDDIFGAKRGIKWQEIERKLREKYKMTGGGEPKIALGLQVTRNRREGTITLSAPQYLKAVVARFGFAAANPVATPMIENSRLVKEGTPLASVPIATYQAVVGSLMWATITVRIDLAVTTSILAQYVSAPTEEHWQAAKRALRYVAGTCDAGVRFGNPTIATNDLDASPLELVGFSDSDHGSDLDTRRSRTGYIFLLNGPISWASIKQSTVAHSTSEAEYMALSEASREALEGTVSNGTNTRGSREVDRTGATLTS